ncbi:hypothetical protein DSCO28_34450 [Desulfosarcina ovata subsp. sediminis]|uniref:Hemolysin D n=2 Tax=Desulfosarcina ovata TaxID=83564 RepID=A0A5K7ZQR9_9BACT|nr:hypothetical protein DSCO28_34450 [Desulfosarcina ovata subsp. sediminis]
MVVMGATFSEHWYRVADLRVALLPSVRVHRQIIRRQLCYILTDPYTQRYFQISKDTYAFLMRLTPQRSVDEIWCRLIDEHPEQAPGQEDVVHILSQLHQANLLYSLSLPDGGGIFERERRMRRRELWGKLMAFLFVRIPLWNPNALLNRIRPLARFFFSMPVALLWVAVISLATMAVVENSAVLYKQSQGVLALANLPWLYLCIAGLKILHEMAHSLACKRYGGDVHTLGIMFLVFVPLPYMDATSSWSFRERRQRILVSSAGMIVELFLAALAALIWCRTGAGLVHSLAFNVMVVGSVSSLLFNGNPLLRYDAYFILSDLVDIPNLSQKSSRQLRYLAERYLMGSKKAVSPATGGSQAAWLTVYGILATWYRFFITLMIILIMLDQFFAVSVILIAMCICIWIIRPAWRLLEYLLSPHIHPHRRQAVTVALSLTLTAVVLITMVPFPYGIKAPGVIEVVEYHPVMTPVAGFMRRIWVQPGQSVRTGQVIVELENHDLETDLTLTRKMMMEYKLILRRALWDSPADREPVEQQLKMLNERLANLEQLREKLIIRAEADGIWVAPPLNEKRDNWFPRGELIGQLVGPEVFRFTAVVSQEQADELFRGTPQAIALRLTGQADQCLDLPVKALTLIPFRQERLASAALGWAGGGAIATLGSDESGELAAEGFFEVRANLPRSASAGQLRLMHGLSGNLRIALASQPLFIQVRKGLLQMMQKRYGLSL